MVAVLSTAAGASAAPTRAPCRRAGSSDGRGRAAALGERDSQQDAPRRARAALAAARPHPLLRYYSVLKSSHPLPATPPKKIFLTSCCFTGDFQGGRHVSRHVAERCESACAGGGRRPRPFRGSPRPRPAP